MERFRLPKSRILRSKKEIDELFSKGKGNTHYPVKVIYLVKKSEQNDVGATAMFVVPKKRFKRAVDRNLLRRRMKEAYRLNSLFIEDVSIEKNLKLNMAFLFTSDQIENFATIQKSIQEILNIVKKGLWLSNV